MINHTRKKGLQVLERRLKRIKDGNAEEREAFVRDYMPFIVKSVSKCMERYIDSMESDEFSIGLQAFDEAIQRYEFAKGNFISYAGLVISSRIKDYMKKESRNKAIPLSSFCTDKGNSLDNVLSEGDFTARLDIKHQMDEFEKKLDEYKINLEQLVEDSPKHIDTRRRAIEVARYVSRNAALKEEFIRKKKLPYEWIRRDLNISQKVLRKSNRFIVAAVLILINDWPELKNQLPEYRREGGGTD